MATPTRPQKWSHVADFGCEIIDESKLYWNGAAGIVIAKENEMKQNEMHVIGTRSKNKQSRKAIVKHTKRPARQH